MAEYQAVHLSQFNPRTVASPYDCNMAAAADALRLITLSAISKNHDQLRHDSGTYYEVLDNNPGNNGTNISDAAHALAVNGVESNIYDSADNKGLVDVLNTIARGNCVIAHGDYGSVPRAYRGAIDSNFTGYHSVIFFELVGPLNVLVGDGLSNSKTLWPRTVVNAYMRDFPGGGYTFLVPKKKFIYPKADYANVRQSSTRQSKIIGRMTYKTQYGSTVLGELIGTNRRWFRVRFDNQIGYVHSSVAETL